jgi:hypothetical protein
LSTPTHERGPETRQDPAKNAASGRVAPGLAKLLEEIAANLEAAVLQRLETRPGGSPAAGGAGADHQKTKEALVQIVNAVVFESGILEKIIARQIDARLGSQPACGGGAAAVPQEALAEAITAVLPKLVKDEIETVVEKKVKSALSGEAMKTLLDEKFRAMSLYLKGDVIPKIVTTALRESKQPA